MKGDFIMSVIDKIIEPLGDADIKAYLPSVKVITYEELGNYNKIEELLPKTRDAVVILYQKNEGYGHWVCICRDNMKITFFDPLGYRPDKQLLWTERYLRKKVGQNIPFMSHLLNKALKNDFKVTFNVFKFQKESSEVNTCGRHVVYFVQYWMQNRTPDIEEYLTTLNRLKHSYELHDYDMLVSRMI
jgi:hypothetical protein